MAKLIDLTQQTLAPWHPLADAEVNGHVIEIGITAGTGEPLFIDWNTQQAWSGCWEDLAGIAFAAYDQEQKHGD